MIVADWLEFLLEISGQNRSDCLVTVTSLHALSTSVDLNTPQRKYLLGRHSCTGGCWRCWPCLRLGEELGRRDDWPSFLELFSAWGGFGYCPREVSTRKRRRAGPRDAGSVPGEGGGELRDGGSGRPPVGRVLSQREQAAREAVLPSWLWAEGCRALERTGELFQVAWPMGRGTRTGCLPFG